jgi:hypothetical protein
MVEGIVPAGALGGDHRRAAGEEAIVAASPESAR